jgi:tRNA pseudouridine55 synthase
LQRLASESIGRFDQMPPIFSAKKVGGRPAYELARKNQTVELKPASVELFEYRLTEIEGPVARFSIECSSGTYVRALAHEMGQKFGCGAHLSEICRTAVGEFSLQQAVSLDELVEAKREGKFQSWLIPLENLLPNYPCANILPVLEKKVRHGGKFSVLISQVQPGRVELPPGATTQLDGDANAAPRLRVFSQQNKLIAIAEAVVPRTYQPIVVFDPLP